MCSAGRRRLHDLFCWYQLWYWGEAVDIFCRHFHLLQVIGSKPIKTHHPPRSYSGRHSLRVQVLLQPFFRWMRRNIEHYTFELHTCSGNSRSLCFFVLIWPDMLKKKKWRNWAMTEILLLSWKHHRFCRHWQVWCFAAPVGHWRLFLRNQHKLLWSFPLT